MSSVRIVAPSRSRDLDEEAVARRVSERVVDDLEVVHVEEQDGDAGSPSAGPIQGPIEVLAEEGPVGEPGQRVVEGVVEELRLQPLLFGRVDEQALRDAAAAGRLVAHRVGLVVHPDDRAVGRDHPVVEAQRLLGLPVLCEGGHGRRPVIRMGQPRPQLRVIEECLGRIAEDGLDLRAHVGEVPAVGDARIGDVDVDGGRDALDEGLVPGIRLGSLDQGDLEVVARVPRVIEQAAPLVDEEGLADAREQDHRERAQLDRAQLGRDHVTDSQGHGAREEGHQRQAAEHRGRDLAEPSTLSLAEAPAASPEADGHDPDRECIAAEAAGGRQADDGLSEPVDPREAEDGETDEEHVATATRRRPRGEQGHQAGRSGGEVHDRERDRHRARDGHARAHPVAVDREDDRGQGEEDRDRIEVDRDLLGLGQPAVDGHHERDDDRRREQQEADVGRCGDLEVAQRGLDHPKALADEPGQRADGDQHGDPAVRARRPAGDQRGEQGGEGAGGGPVGVLPEGDLAADVEDGEGHERAEDDETDPQDDGLGSGVDGPRPGSLTADALTRHGGHGRPRGLRSQVPLGSGAVHSGTLRVRGASLHHRFAP